MRKLLCKWFGHNFGTMQFLNNYNFDYKQTCSRCGHLAVYFL